MGKEPCGGLEAIYSAERMLELKRRQEPSIEDTSLRTYDSSQRAYVEFCESLPVSPNAEPWKDWFLNGFRGPIDDAAKVSHSLRTSMSGWPSTAEQLAPATAP